MPLNPNRCTACGTPFTDHDGVAKTCMALQESRREVQVLRAENARLAREIGKLKVKSRVKR